MRAMELTRIRPMTAHARPLELVERPRPEPAAGEVLIRVAVCGVCHTELDEIEGRVACRLPVIPGHQAVGEVIEAGSGADTPAVGARVGVGWIFSACGECRLCRSGRENLCPQFRATGCDAHGGYAEYLCVPAGFAVPIPDNLETSAAAPMLCGGAIGLRSLRLTEMSDGQILGLSGFGGSNHQVLQLARVLYPESPVYVWARNPDQRRQALDAGAAWAGDTEDPPPRPADAVIDTTPVWKPVLAALKHLAPGGRLVINAIRKEDGDRELLAKLDYPSQLWREKSVKSVANVTRADIRDMLDLAARHGLRPRFTRYPLEQANRALAEIRRGRIDGAKVLVIGGAG